MKKRIYKSPARKAQAQKTKQRLLAAAKKLFQKKGVEKTTIEDIALLAQTSVPTVYSLFQSKLGVLRTLLDNALSQDRFEALVQKGTTEKSPIKRLEATARIARALYDAEKNLIDLLDGAVALDPTFKKLETKREKRRYFRQEEAMKYMSEKGYLRADLSLAKAQDILWAFTGRDLYRLMVIERGWSADEYEKWLADLLIRTLLKK
ncbi:MAG: TetR/AcrR family transcriptional regulator [Verrucomicrobia bacterium]|nr:TetR/AcrR family transcriptional regulator [Verrucomicrobiota bacterium]